jgi:hypothetical protein
MSLVALGCASPRAHFPGTFELPDDALAYKNDLIWLYSYDEEGRMTGKQRIDSPDYSHRCFAQVRTVRLYFQYARFAPGLPRLDRAAYRELVQQVHDQDPRRRSPPEQRVVIPGYASLFEFSTDHADLIKEADGGMWRSYVQRGNWRMVIPFSGGHQERTARALMSSIDRNRPPVARLVRFPRITVNHTVLPYAYQVGADSTTFLVYDPNLPAAPAELVFDHRTRRFVFPRTDYFEGGRVDVYEIFDAFFF